jgi:Uri superfamily endonuclease
MPPLSPVKALPSSSGTYALILRLERPAVLSTGRLGEFKFPPADYVYLGSAFGPGGIRSRLGRHLRGANRLHWHIDYLLPAAQITGFCYTLVPRPLECRWVQLLALQPGAGFPVHGFGASDCRAHPRHCPAHLLAFSRPLLAPELSRILAAAGKLPVEAVNLCSNNNLVLQSTGFTGDYP